MATLGGSKRRKRPRQPKSDAAKVVDRAVSKYKRGKSNVIKGVADKKLRANIKADEVRFRDAAASAASAEVLLTEQAGYLEAGGPMERTYKYTQREIAKHVDLQTTQKMFDLQLDEFGPYQVDFSRSGRQMLLGGDKGHLAMVDTLRSTPICDFHVGDKVRDVKFLHDHSMFAVAQKKYVHIYDNHGTELHCLRHHVEPFRLDFLPYHFLMVTAGRTGFVKWQDTSTGQLVSEFRTKRGPCDCLRQNPRNAVVCLGHADGVVTMWSPSVSTPLVKMMCHRGAVAAVAVDMEGRYLVTAGADSQMKVWDVRTYKSLHSYYTNSPATSIDVSQLGVLAVGFGSHVQLWKDALGTKAAAPYMRHSVSGSEVRGVRFKPFDDVLGVAHRTGLSSIVVPGSGEPNYDAHEANPYQTGKQRKEATVHALLEKLQPSMITLDPTEVGRVDRAPAEVIERERTVAAEAAAAQGKPKKERRKARGRSKAGKRYAKKMQNVIMDERSKARESKDRAEKSAARKDHTDAARGSRKVFADTSAGTSARATQSGKARSKGEMTSGPEAGALARFSRTQAKG